MTERRVERRQQIVVIAFQSDQKNRVGKVVTVREIRGFFVFSCGMQIAEQLPFPVGADTEAEIGRIGKTESGEDCKAECADPDECIRFIKETNVTSLAVAIGNAHGVYQGTPLLRFDILEKIRKQTDLPLVLHGGTGLTPNDFRACISLGVNKINIATATFMACRDAAQDAEDYFDMSRRMEQAAYETAKRHMDLFGHFTL